MPRPTRAQGRPGTQVIPTSWGRDHAPVVRKTCTALVEIRSATTNSALPVMADDFTYADTAATDALYTGGARIQALNAKESESLAADQNVVTAGYLVVIDRDADDIPLNAVVQVTASSDATLIGGRRLIVRKVARGTERFERDLWCIDDLTYQPEE